jgi:small-conductance mechanosensitive channel
LLKTKVTNLTRFPIRRVDLEIPVAYSESLDRVRDLLFVIADRNAHCLAEPQPLFFVTRFGDSSLFAQLSVWCATESFLLLKTSLSEDIRRAFEEQKIRRPYTHQVVLAEAGATPAPAVDGG